MFENVSNNDSDTGSGAIQTKGYQNNKKRLRSLITEMNLASEIFFIFTHV